MDFEAFLYDGMDPLTVGQSRPCEEEALKSAAYCRLLGALLALVSVLLMLLRWDR
jgi:hypothetical protein